MAAEMCRVSIRSVHREADLAVFAHLPLCELMPSVAAMLGDDVDGQDVRLGRVDGDVLDPAQSLAQSGVCDGEVLILTTAAERTAQSNFDLCDAVAQAVMRADPREPATHLPVATVAALWSAVAVAALLVRCVVGPAIGGVGIGCAGMASALAGALMVRRHRNMSTTLGLVGSAFAGLTALLAVPALPGFLLAMSAVSATSLGLWRILGFGTRMFLPLSGATMAAAAASLPVALEWLPTQYAGPILTTASVAILAVSPRLASRL
ncbi:MAG TPA: EsaB/YukD family protein, partial [Mycobacterium sp.]|nr:EsaB/YukD family protein [Mycobacterium sp.]